MEARRVVAHPSVKDDDGFVAVERGPLVYCAEWPDNGGRALDIVLPRHRGPSAGGTDRTCSAASSSLDGRRARGRSRRCHPARRTLGSKDAAADDEEDAPPASRRRLAPGAALKPHRLVLIPYYAWAHRGAGEMSVWLFKSKKGGLK